jgi:hypothetical protein
MTLWKAGHDPGKRVATPKPEMLLFQMRDSVMTHHMEILGSSETTS